jgi:hypothetical protein
MDGSRTSGGEGCLGGFRHLRCFLLVLRPSLLPNITGEHAAVRLRSVASVAVSMGSAASRSSRLSSSGEAFARRSSRPLASQQCIDVRHVQHRQSKSIGN